MTEKKRLLLNLFEMNTVSHISHGLWPLEGNNRHRFNDLDYWLELADILENGGDLEPLLADDFVWRIIPETLGALPRNKREYLLQLQDLGTLFASLKWEVCRSPCSSSQTHGPRSLSPSSKATTAPSSYTS